MNNHLERYTLVDILSFLKNKRSDPCRVLARNGRGRLMSLMCIYYWSWGKKSEVQKWCMYILFLQQYFFFIKLFYKNNTHLKKKVITIDNRISQNRNFFFFSSNLQLVLCLVAGWDRNWKELQRKIIEREGKGETVGKKNCAYLPVRNGSGETTLAVC